MTSGGDAGGIRGGSSPSDEEWERFLIESEDGVRDAPKEPSARARMVTRRLREEDAAAAVAASSSRSRLRRVRRVRRPRTRRPLRSGWYAVGLVAVLALLIVALSPARVTELTNPANWFGDDADSGSGAPLATESVRPTGPPPSEVAGRATLDDPFRGSPAARWADGFAGIGLPPARATGWMTRAQVARALERSRDFLVASSLDRGVLRGERPTEAIALINPHQPKERTFLDRSLSTPSEKYNPLLLFSRFDTGRVRMVGDVVKTRGRVSFRAGGQGALEVTTDVTYVYPVVRAGSADGRVTRVIVRREVVMNWDDPEKVVTEPGTFSVVSNRLDTTNAGCDTYDGYLTPPFTDDRATGEGPAVDPYDRSTTMDERMRGAGDDKCGTAVRS
ncbi:MULTISPECIES: hypothetical protein [unclassified Streptomyces]|uniref:hypothetical protein n=1 Tax=unclassified Streptomyces TaxID=2593676 RepID=UPI00278BF55F|nr:MULTISPECIES: hypothetical protein [unclassified Streptomyces]